MSEYKRKSCISCPACGKVIQKSYMTYSEMQCPKCHHAFLVYAKDGMKFEVELKPENADRVTETLGVYFNKIADLLRET